MQQTWHFDDNTYAQWATEPAPAEDLRDEAGRLLDPRKVEEANQAVPEDLELFVSCWKEQRLASQVEWGFSSRFVFPEVDYTVCMQRLDLYENSTPRTQQATLNKAESLRIRSVVTIYWVHLMLAYIVSIVPCVLEVRRDGFQYDPYSS